MLVTIIYRSTARLNEATVNVCPADINSITIQHPQEKIKLVVNDAGGFIVRKGRADVYGLAKNKAQLIERYAPYFPTGTIKGNQLTLTV